MLALDERGREIIGDPECPIMYRRTLFDLRWIKLLQHEFVPGNDRGDPHDHPRSFLTFVYRGGYQDVTPCEWCMGEKLMHVPGGYGYDADGTFCPPKITTIVCHGCRGSGEGEIDEVKAPALRFRRAKHAHVTRSVAGARTLVLMGPVRRDWGFWRDGKWLPSRTHDRLFGKDFKCPE